MVTEVLLNTKLFAINYHLMVSLTSLSNVILQGMFNPEDIH